ncbi:DNA cytosine methyltransferase [Ferrovibrio terrae]|uniref:DNA cytosine methyltransferase n=1 Tax=Ferrovibrio terrae TaxID=2594003 RepID=UPI003137A20F
MRQHQSDQGREPITGTPASVIHRGNYDDQRKRLGERKVNVALSPFNGLALCAGGGGLELGIHIAEPEYRTVCYVEREAYAAAALVARMEDKALSDAPVWSDVTSFNGRPWRGVVDILSAGYPCQPFSSAGKKLGTADPRHLWPHVARIVREIEPEWLFLENVPHHLRVGFPVVANDLREMGYRFVAGLFSAREAGAAHFRRRLFVLAHADREQCRRLASSACGRHDAVLRSAERKPIRAANGRADLVSVVGYDRRNRRRARYRATSGELPVYAPGPGALEAWAHIIGSDPSLKPALWRDADGLADWVDRNRVVGNGVSSVAAAFAFCTLKAELFADGSAS